MNNCLNITYTGNGQGLWLPFQKYYNIGQLIKKIKLAKASKVCKYMKGFQCSRFEIIKKNILVKYQVFMMMFQNLLVLFEKHQY